MKKNNDILSALLDDPKNLMVLAFVCGSSYLLPEPLLLGLILMPSFHWTAFPRLAVLGFGVLFVTLPWLILNINLDYILRLNHWLFMQLIHGNWWALLDSRVLLYSFPVALIYASIFSWLLKRKQGLHTQMSQLVKGKSISNVAFKSERHINKVLHKTTMSAVQNGTLLGVDRETGGHVCLYDNDANLHTLAIGTTGSGKTTGLCNIIESSIIRKIPLIYVDGKGDTELAKQIGKFAAKNKVPFYLFSMTGNSMKYNPLASGGITSKKDRIVELREWSEDHYRKIAEGYLQTVFMILDKYKVETDLYSLAQYLEPKRKAIELSTDPDNPIVTLIKRIIIDPKE